MHITCNCCAVHNRSIHFWSVKGTSKTKCQRKAGSTLCGPGCGNFSWHRYYQDGLVNWRFWYDSMLTYLSSLYSKLIELIHFWKSNIKKLSMCNIVLLNSYSCSNLTHYLTLPRIKRKKISRKNLSYLNNSLKITDMPIELKKTFFSKWNATWTLRCPAPGLALGGV